MDNKSQDGCIDAKKCRGLSAEQNARHQGCESTKGNSTKTHLRTQRNLAARVTALFRHLLSHCYVHDA